MQNKASKIFMVRPVLFGFNPQTANSNSFQHTQNNAESQIIQAEAVKEFDDFVLLLRKNKIDVTVFEDTTYPHTPDSIFPNNWISFHENNTVVLYPMLAPNRRMERRADIIEALGKNKKRIDLSEYENNGAFLEGTGSIVFDYKNTIAYANLSPRTDKNLLELLCKKINCQTITFKAVDTNKQDIYHTNVLMTIGDTFAVICTECIPDKNELEKVLNSLKATNHEIITISYSQMNAFTGNMYQLFNEEGKSFLIMSEQAFKSLTPQQIEQLKKHTEILHTPLYTIEKYGGGSARCMIADMRA
jgi:hypothetical protein